MDGRDIGLAGPGLSDRVGRPDGETSSDPHEFLTEFPGRLGMLCAMGVPRSPRNEPGLASNAMTPGRRRRAVAPATLVALTLLALVAASCSSGGASPSATGSG